MRFPAYSFPEKYPAENAGNGISKFKTQTP